MNWKWTYALIVFIAISCGKGDDLQDADIPKTHPTDEYKEAFHEAMREKMIGHYDLAIPLFQKCLEYQPENAAVYFALSDLYEKTGQQSKSIECAEKAQQYDQENRWYKLRLANIYFDQGNYQKSAMYFEQVMDQEKNLDTKYKYTEALIKSEQAEKAIGMLNEIEVEVGKGPEISLTKHDMYMQLGKFDEAERELQELIEYDPSNIENRMIVGDIYMRTGQVQKAEALVTDALERFPESGESHVLAADLNLRKGNVEAAFEELKIGFAKTDIPMDRKLELLWGLMPFAFNPSNPDDKLVQKKMEEIYQQIYDEKAKNDQLHHHYGVFLQNLGKEKEARDQFKIVCDINPDSYESWSQLLTIEYELELFQDLATDGEKAVELFPAQPVFYLLTAIGNYESEKYETANEWFMLGQDFIVDDDMLKSEFLLHQGIVARLQKDNESSFSLLRKSIQLYHGNGKAYHILATYLLEDGKVEEAEKEVSTGLSEFPDDLYILDAYGMILIEKKQYPKAVSTFEKALMIDVFNPEVLEHYGDALFLIGDTDKAVEIWSNAKKYGGESDLLNRKITDKKYYAD